MICAIVTSRCKLKNYDSIEIKELDKEKELTELILQALSFCKT